VHTETPVERLAYSPGEAGEVIGVSRQHIYSMIQRGELRTITTGSRRLVPRSALLELLGETEAA
jgi:excisionase family DNA binding protein